jgi:hypothetical protein
MPEPTSPSSAALAAKRVLYPLLQILCYGFLGLAILSTIFVLAVEKSTVPLEGFRLSLHAFVLRAMLGGLPLLALTFGFIGLLFLRLWEKVAVLIAMMLLAWLLR